MGTAGFLIAIYMMVYLVIIALVIVLIALAIKALAKYLREDSGGKGKEEIRRPLGEALKECRTRCNMTQEFVAESVGVSRQAVSKWENGASEPSASNLCALAKLYQVSVEDLLRSIQI